MTRYVLQVLDGYTDGKPSWLKVRAYWSREDAQEAAHDERVRNPNRVYRVRKIIRR